MDEARPDGPYEAKNPYDALRYAQEAVQQAEEANAVLHTHRDRIVELMQLDADEIQKDGLPAEITSLLAEISHPTEYARFSVNMALYVRLQRSESLHEYLSVLLEVTDDSLEKLEVFSRELRKQAHEMLCIAFLINPRASQYPAAYGI